MVMVLDSIRYSLIVAVSDACSPQPSNMNMLTNAIIVISLILYYYNIRYFFLLTAKLVVLVTIPYTFYSVVIVNFAVAWTTFLQEPKFLHISPKNT